MAALPYTVHASSLFDYLGSFCVIRLKCLKIHNTKATGSRAFSYPSVEADINICTFGKHS